MTRRRALKSLGKSRELLRVVATGGVAGVREMARSVGLPRSTTHRLLRALEAEGLVQRTTGRTAATRDRQRVALKRPPPSFPASTSPTKNV